jgi:hypothetical protein
MPEFNFRSPYIAFEEYIIEAETEEEALKLLKEDSNIYYSDDQKNYDTYSIPEYFKELNKPIPEFPEFEFVGLNSELED